MIGKLTYEQMDEVLQENTIGRIGCNDGDKTYIVPVNYVYDGKFIIAHSFEGMKIEMMRKNKHVCFEVDEIKDITNWRSVIAWGEYQELTHERDRYAAMKLFTDRMLHLKTSKAPTTPAITAQRVHPDLNENKRPVIYRIVIIHKTGRFENE